MVIAIRFILFYRLSVVSVQSGKCTYPYLSFIVAENTFHVRLGHTILYGYLFEKIICLCLTYICFK